MIVTQLSRIDALHAWHPRAGPRATSCLSPKPDSGYKRHIRNNMTVRIVILATTTAAVVGGGVVVAVVGAAAVVRSTIHSHSIRNHIPVF